MKKGLIYLLLISLLMGTIIFPIGTSAAELITTDTGWNGSAAVVPAGSGTEQDPYLISCAENLQWMRNVLHGKQYFATIGYNGDIWHPTYTDGWEECMGWESGKTTSFTVGGKTGDIDIVPKTAVLSDFKDMPHVYCIQTCDIDLNGKTLQPIGSYWKYSGNGSTYVKGQWFSGTYDGQGYSIKNGNINPGGTSSTAWNAAGLFGNVWGSTVKNLTFDNVQVTGHVNMGLVAGNVIAPSDFGGDLDEATYFADKENVFQNIQIKNTCSVTHSVHANMGTAAAYVGGLVGTAAYNTDFLHCRNDADIVHGIYALGVGGIAGRMMKNCRVDFCVNTGNIRCTGGALVAGQQPAYGGIVGTWQYNGTAEYHGVNSVTNCVNTGTLLASDQAIATDAGNTVISYGGIVGRTFQLTLAKNANGNATKWLFENNINLGASPTLCDGYKTSANPRSAAGIGSVWNGNTTDWLIIEAKNCYTVNTFVGLTGYPLVPGASCPILCAKSGYGKADAANNFALSENEIKALPLYRNIMNGVGTTSAPHKLVGVQTKAEENGTYTVRFISGIDSLEYKAVSFDLMARMGDKQAGRTYTSNKVFTAFKAKDSAGNDITVHASDYGYSYLTIVTVKGLAKDTEYTLSMTPEAETVAALPGESGRPIEGDPWAITVTNTEVSFLDLSGHSVKIDGTDISEFVILLPAEASTSEQNLAKLLQSHLYQTTGHKLTIADDTAAEATHEIRIGSTARSTAVALTDGQYAVIPSDGDLQISYTNNASLAELTDKLFDVYFNEDATDINLTLNGNTVTAQANHPVLGTLANGKIQTAAATQLNTVDDAVFAKLKILGRSVKTATGIAMDWSATTLEFNANCEGDVKATINASAAVRFLVYVDGTLVNTLRVASGTNIYTLAKDLEAGDHHVRLVRTTRVELSNVGQLAEIQNLILDGTLGAKPADKTYLIEFLGDSVTAGVGAKASIDKDAYVEHTFAYQTAMELDADYSVIAVPGIGTLSGTSRHDKLGDTILNIYQSTSHYRAEDLSYSPARQADLVVIGTNANDDAKPDETAFKAQVRALIDQARTFNGNDVKIVWVFNMYNNRDTINGYVEEVFAEYGGESAGFYTLDFYVDNSGGAVHPSAAAHDDYTERLVNLIKSKNILK